MPPNVGACAVSMHGDLHFRDIVCAHRGILRVGRAIARRDRFQSIRSRYLRFRHRFVDHRSRYISQFAGGPLGWCLHQIPNGQPSVKLRRKYRAVREDVFRCDQTIQQIKLSLSQQTNEGPLRLLELELILP